MKNHGTYSVTFRYGEEEIHFLYTTLSSRFERVDTLGRESDEEYFLLDVLDFLDGKQELYSNFWHKIESKKTYRLWTFLGANFCNNDLVLKKYRLHFERAKRFETSEGYFENIKKVLKRENT